MLRSPLPFLLVLCGACATSGAATETPETTTPSSSVAVTTVTGDGGGTASLDEEIVRTAHAPEKVVKMKVRVDEGGTIVKQSLYHDDAEAIPEAVKALASERFPNAKPVRFETELYADHGRVYEVEVDDGGTRCEVAATPEGTELYTECQVDPASLSAAAKATIDRVAPGGTVQEVETKKGPEIDEITVEVEHEGRALYLWIGPDGALIQALHRVPAVIEIPLP